MSIASINRATLKIFSDWLSLLDGPQRKVFSEIVEKENWARLFKLITLILLLSGAILGATLTIETLTKDSVTTVVQSRLALTFLIVGAILAAAYNGIARLFGIKITMSQSFFILLSLGMPWIPIFLCIDAIPSLPEFKLQGIIFIFSHLVLIKPLVNFVRGVKIVTKCPLWRVLISILLPLFVFTFLVVYMFG